MKKNIMSLAVAATLSLAALSASAEDMYNGSWYVVPGGTFVNPENFTGAKNAGGAFIRLGKEVSQYFDVQAGVGYDTSKADGTVPVPGTTGRYKQTVGNLDALFMPMRGNFRPFLLAGVGIARNKLDYVGVTNSSKTSWLVNAGLGAQYLINDTFGLQADVRAQLSRAQYDAGLGVQEDKILNTVANLGGIFRFGGAPAQVAAPAPAPYVAPEPAPYVAPEPAPAPAPAPVSCEPKSETITVGAEKLFAFDKANLKAEGKAALDDAAAKIKANPEIKNVVVTGYTDRIGSDAYNMKLSARRAQMVASYLAAQGVSSNMISSEGKGKADPVVQCAGNKATAKLIACLQPNRRVEIRAEGQREVGCNN